MDCLFFSYSVPYEQLLNLLCYIFFPICNAYWEVRSSSRRVSSSLLLAAPAIVKSGVAPAAAKPAGAEVSPGAHEEEDRAASWL